MNVDIKRSLHPLRIRYAAPLLRRARAFWLWWSGELFELLPENMQKAIAQRQQKLYVEVNDGQFLMSLGNHVVQQEVMRLPVDTADVEDADIPREVQQTILLLPGDKVLSTHISLPAAAEENLREVLGFEMDLHTPFEASEVYYDFTVIGRDSERQELTVDLVYAPRGAVETLVERGTSLGLKTDIVTCRTRDQNNLQQVNLMPPDKRRARRLEVKNLYLAMTALLAIVVVVAITMPLVQKNRAIEIIEAQVQVAATEASEGSQLRHDLEKMAEASRVLVAKKAQETLTDELVDEISRIIPDHTWVSRVDLSSSELQLQGQSSASESLIAIIEASPRFENVGFGSPVVQISGTNRDRIQISADVVQVQPQ